LHSEEYAHVTKQPGTATRSLTSRQLAALIGVSQSAVSRAFTPGSSISDEMRNRILTSAREYGYLPNAIASMLTKRRTNMVGIVVSDMSNPFYPQLIEKLTQGIQRAELQSLLFNVTPGSNIEEQLVAIRSYNIDSLVIIAANVISQRALSWASEGRKSILLNRLGSEEIASVSCDNVLGTRAVVDHFHDLGYSRIGYVAGLRGSSVALQRYGAFTARLAELGMSLVGTATRHEHSYAAGWGCALELLERKPQAIFFASDILALGGLDALKQEGAADDIAVAGFDDIPMASWPHYSLTTYRQPIDAMVERTMELLLSPERDVQMVHNLPGELVIRASSHPKASDGL
jgi:DNA-binding LacI/PurR family transcriptional regulator